MTDALDRAAEAAHNAFFYGDLPETGIERELWRDVVCAVRAAEAADPTAEISYAWGVRYRLLPDEVCRTERESEARSIASHGHATVVRAVVHTGAWEEVTA